MASEAKAGVRRYRMYINGEFVESLSGKYFPVVDPSTEETMAEVPEAGEKDVDRAVAAAKAAFDSGAWPQTTAQDRGRILFSTSRTFARKLRISLNWKRGIRGSQSLKLSTTSMTLPPALNITAGWPRKYLDT